MMERVPLVILTHLPTSNTLIYLHSSFIEPSLYLSHPPTDVHPNLHLSLSLTHAPRYMQQRRSYEPLQATFVPFSLSLSLSLPSPSTHIGRLCLITFMQQQKAQQGLSAPTANFLKPFTDEGKAAVVLWSRGGELFPPVKTRPQTSHIHPYERRAQGMRQKWRRFQVPRQATAGRGVRRQR